MESVFLMAALAAAGAVVVEPAANMYSKPSLDADVVSQAIYAANIGLIEEKDGWARVQTADGYTGWMPAASFLRAARPYAAAGRVAQVASLFANLYREPSVTRRRPLLTVPFETRLEVAAEPEREERRWIQVRLPGGGEAWVQRGDVEFDPAPLSADATIALARRFLGFPYLWGGTSSLGFDCSGFTQMLCRRRGVTIPRDAGPQARWDGMAPVGRAELRAGDLIYFGSSLEKITHTGMYIGGGEFIHFTTHQRPVAQISRLGDPYWSKLFVCARRLKP